MVPLIGEVARMARARSPDLPLPVASARSRLASRRSGSAHRTRPLISTLVANSLSPGAAEVPISVQ